ncbi:MAG: helix-turn-helix domain-containing protein [bacterium]
MKAIEKRLRSKDVAHILDCCPDDVHELARRGRLRAFKVGRFWLYRHEDVVAYKKQMEMAQARTVGLLTGRLLKGDRTLLNDLAVSINIRPGAERWRGVFRTAVKDREELDGDILYTLLLKDGRKGAVLIERRVPSEPVEVDVRFMGVGPLQQSRKGNSGKK